MNRTLPSLLVVAAVGLVPCRLPAGPIVPPGSLGTKMSTGGVNALSGIKVTPDGNLRRIVAPTVQEQLNDLRSESNVLRNQLNRAQRDLAQVKKDLDALKRGSSQREDLLKAQRAVHQSVR